MTRQEKDKKKIDDAYKVIREKYPDAQADSVEYRVREYLMNQKLKPAGALGICTIVLAIIFGIFSPEPADVTPITNLFSGLALGGSSICGLAAVMILAKTLHNPLTPTESKELRERDKVEKGGGLSDCDN